jgi:hypothetical protein
MLNAMSASMCMDGTALLISSATARDVNSAQFIVCLSI